jgi:hypothetical protein
MIAVVAFVVLLAYALGLAGFAAWLDAATALPNLAIDGVIFVGVFAFIPALIWIVGKDCERAARRYQVAVERRRTGQVLTRRDSRILRKYRPEGDRRWM